MAAATGAACLDVHERPWGAAIPGLLLGPAMIERHVLRLSFEAIVRLHRGLLTTDGIHQGPVGGGHHRDFARAWLLEVLGDRAPEQPPPGQATRAGAAARPSKS